MVFLGEAIKKPSVKFGSITPALLSYTTKQLSAFAFPSCAQCVEFLYRSCQQACGQQGLAHRFGRRELVKLENGES